MLMSSSLKPTKLFAVCLFVCSCVSDSFHEGGVSSSRVVVLGLVEYYCTQAGRRSSRC